MEVSSHAPGTFCWAELQTSDSASAKAFYEAVLGWQYADMPIGPNTIYSIAKVDGKSVGALYSDPSGSRATAWTTYIRVSSADETTATAKANRASIIAGPFDVNSVGRMAVIQDPTGAVFHVWEPLDNQGYNLVKVPGAVCWNELNTKEPSVAEAFYAKVFGYGIKHSDMGGPYTEFQLNGESVCGMPRTEPSDVSLPPHWLIIFAVENCDSAVEVATACEGNLLCGPMEVPGVGNFAVIRDPQGGMFGIVD